MSKESYLQIGEFSKICNVSIQALRYYEKIGLIAPDYVDEDSGYRYYSKNKIFKLTNIGLLKSAGFKLSEISSILKRESIVDVTNFYMSKIRELDDEMEKIENKKAQAQSYLDFFKSLLSDKEVYSEKDLDKISIIEAPKEEVVFIKDTLTFDYPSLMFLYNQLLKLIFDNKLNVEKPIISTFYSNYTNMYHKEVEIELSMKLSSKKKSLPSIRTREKTKVLSCLHKGKYPSSVPIYKKMLSYAKGNNFVVSGNIMHYLIVPIASVKSPDDTVFELRLPVRES